MPTLDDLIENNIPGSNYGYSGTRIDNLGSTEYTLVGLAADDSGSIFSFASEINRCVADTVEACRRSPRADSLMIRVTSFDQRLTEFHGFKPLADCKGDDYRNVVRGGGSTALFDAAQNAVQAVTDYGDQLQKADFSVNGIVVVVTDGDDNASIATANSVGQALKAAVTGEKLESLVSILVGVNVTDSHMKRRLEEFAQQAGFTQFVDAGKADAKSLAKLADFVSKSISSQSQALGSGGASKALTF